MATETTTTQILFNSPALHSLKRDQLVKLCKIHSIKANGKNVELIERLKQRAQELPPEAQFAEDEDATMADAEQESSSEQDIPGSMPAESSDSAPQQGADEDYDMQDVVLTSRFAIPRPSEQWEVVMDDIVEEDESAMNTMSSKGSLRTVSNGEFGTHSSKASVSSSIKALATSLGIKRVGSKSSHHTQGFDFNSEGNKMPSFSPGKLFGSTKARDSLADHATPYADIPPSDILPETDHFKFSTPDTSILDVDEDPALDGENGDTRSVASRATLRLPGIGGAAVKSTIRLVSHPAAAKAGLDYAYMSPPRLPVVKTDFDITVGTPGTMRSLSMWPASPRPAGADSDSLYPKLPLEDLRPRVAQEDEDGSMPGGMHAGPSTTTPAKGLAFPTSTTKSIGTPGPIDEPDMFSPSKPTAGQAARTSTPVASGSRGTLPRTTPFLFGSPLPRRTPTAAADAKTEDGTKADPAAGVSNTAFDGVAKSVLEEMQRRLAEQKAASGSAADGSKPSLSTSTQPPIFDLIARGTGGGGVGGAPPDPHDRFKRAHDAEFKKMDSITTHYAARRPNKRKSDALGVGRPGAGQKRRSSAAGARVISAGARKRMAVPGGFGEDEEEDGDGEEENGGEEASAGRGRDEEEDAGARRSSKRMRITQGWDVHRGQRVSLAPPLPPAEEEKKQKEREAVKRELDAAKARRRSSRGRPSMGAPPAKGKSSRFGFLGAAKSLVRNVWGMGGSKAKAAATAAPSSIPVPKPALAPTTAPSSSADTKGKGKSELPSRSATASSRKVSGPQARPPSVASASGPNKLLKPHPTSDARTNGTVTSNKSIARSRSPIPSFTNPSGTVKSTTTVASGPGSMAGTARSRISSTGSNSGSAASRQTRTSTVSSMGTRTSMNGASGAASSLGTRRSLTSTNTLNASTSSKTDSKAPASAEAPQPTLRKRTSSLLAPTASSLAKTNASVRPSMSGRTSGLPSVAEAQKAKRTSVITSQPGSAKATIAAAKSPMSPRPTRIFSQPLTNFSSPTSASSPGATPVHPSLAAAATSIMGAGMKHAGEGHGHGTTDLASSPSKIPRPAVLPPKPKQLVARKPRISRSRVIAKLGAQRAAAAQGLTVVGSPSRRTRSSVGAGAARRSFGGVKSARASAGAEGLRSAMVKKRARQSEYHRRKSRAANENDSLAVEA